MTELSEAERDWLTEAFAAYLHQLWWSWSAELAVTEPISEERLDRWRECWRPYDALGEDMKDADREYARALLDHLERYDRRPDP